MQDEQPFIKTGKRMYILVWLLFFILMMIFFYSFTREKKGAVLIQSDKVVIKADQQGHYRIAGAINEQPVTFLVDTGATYVAIPKEVADQAGLIAYYPISAQTANGTINGYLTRLKQLRFAGFVLEDVKAVIIPGGLQNTALLGMNVLAQFVLMQKGGDLIISKP